MEIDLNRVKNLKDGREQLLVSQYTKEGVEGVFYACKLNEEGLSKIYTNDVVGAIVAIVESYSNLVPESVQIEFENEITSKLLEVIENRHDKIVEF